MSTSVALTSIAPRIVSRPFRDDADFWRIRNLSIETYPRTGLGWNWDLRRWDGSRFYSANPVLNPDWQRTIRLWETEDGMLAGAVNSDGAGWFYLQINPDYRDLIEEEMIAWAEENLAKTDSETRKRQIQIEVFEYDGPRQRLLERCGFERLPAWGVIRRRWLGKRPLPEVHLAEGYTLREVWNEDMEDCQRMADLLNAAFNRTFHCAEEFYQFARLAPSFRPDLHLVAVAPDGRFAAHVGVIYDEANLRAFYEPVCTHPQHRRKNLAQSLMLEGLHRVKGYGAREVAVETGDMPAANALYDAFGFTEVYKSCVWRKLF